MSDQTIDLGVNYEDVKDMDRFPLLPDAVHQFVITKIEKGQTGAGSKTPGRPKLSWTLVFNHPDSGQKVTLTYTTVLPWIAPGQSEVDITGIGNLVAICKEVGLPWAGMNIDPSQYLGRAGHALVEQRKRQMKDPATGQYVDDPNGKPVNNIVRMACQQ